MQKCDSIASDGNQTAAGCGAERRGVVARGGLFYASGEDLRDGLRGFPASCIEAALRYQSFGRMEDFDATLRGLIGFHLPRRARPLPRTLGESLKLREDLGLDSLALMELAFKLEELFGIEIDPSGTPGITTVGQLQQLVRSQVP